MSQSKLDDIIGNDNEDWMFPSSGLSSIALFSGAVGSVKHRYTFHVVDTSLRFSCLFLRMLHVTPAMRRRDLNDSNLISHKNIIFIEECKYNTPSFKVYPFCTTL